MRAPRSQSLVGQELISFDGPDVIDVSSYSVKEAREAASHRTRRRGELALTAVNKGFRNRVDLWVPHSRGENSAVVSVPLRVILDRGQFAYRKTLEKYKDSEVRMSTYMAWAMFAGRSASREVIQKFDSYRHEAQELYRGIHMGLGPDGEIERETIEASDYAMNGVARYLVALRGFTAHKWTRPYHTKETARQRKFTKPYTKQMDWAREQLDHMPAWDFNLTFKEAYYSERSRNIFWEGVERSRKAAERMRSQELALQLNWTPIEVYDDDPRAYAYNYVDGEFIG